MGGYYSLFFLLRFARLTRQKDRLPTVAVECCNELYFIHTAANGGGEGQQEVIRQA
jgi:hypothetical protein